MPKIKDRIARPGEIMTYTCRGDEGDGETLKVKIIKTRREKSQYTKSFGRCYTLEVLETLWRHENSPREKGETFDRFREEGYDWERERALRKFWPGHNYNYWDLYK